MPFSELPLHKKTAVTLLLIIVSPLAVAALLLTGIFALFTIPFEIPRYRKSAYFKRYGKNLLGNHKAGSLSGRQLSGDGEHRLHMAS